MREILIHFLGFMEAFWFLFCEMAPYLWVGFVLTFFLKWWVPPAWIRQHLGGEGWRPVFWATVAGVPLPLCSCGVLPVAAAIRREGGGRSAVAAFTVTTPQTGVDSILATAGLLGWAMAWLRVGTALLSGLLTGFLVGLWARKKRSAHASTEVQNGCCSCGAPHEKPPPADSKETEAAVQDGAAKFHEAVYFTWVRLPADIGLALMVGTLVAALLVVAAPNWTQIPWPGGVLGAYALVSLVAVPVYVCSTGVIPLVFALLAAGFPPGAAFILLAAGPSVSATSLFTLGRLIGWPGALISAFSLLVVTWSAGALLDFSALGQIVPACELHESTLLWWKHAAAGALLLLLITARWREWRQK